MHSFLCEVETFLKMWPWSQIFVYQQEILNHFAQACIDGTLTLENLSFFRNHFTSF
jgi:hypothetical protein